MISIGDATITPIFEVDAGKVIAECIAETTPENILHIDWLAPSYVNPDGTLKAQVQAFYLEMNGKKIIIDPGVGNGRDRPELPAWANLQTDFYERLKTIVDPAAIDYVLCTHLHFDHVGWNTRLVNGKWVPTFPNAEYVFSQAEFEYWRSKPVKEVVDDLNGFAESVLPVYEAGLVTLVPDDARITEGVSFIPTPGHTPHHVSILLESGGKSAVITGDVFHHPCQIAHPEWKTFDTDSDQANVTRKQLLERFADADTIFIGSHFAEPIAGTVARSGSGFRLEALG